MWLLMLPARTQSGQHKADNAASAQPSARRRCSGSTIYAGQHTASEPRRVDGLPEAPGAPGSVMLRSSVPPAAGAAGDGVKPRLGLPPPPPVSALAPDRRGISSASCSSSSGRKRWPPDPNPCPRFQAPDDAEPHSPPSSPPPAPAARRAPRARHHPRAATNTMPASNAATATPATASTRVSGAGLHAWAACGARSVSYAAPTHQAQPSTTCQDHNFCTFEPTLHPMLTHPHPARGLCSTVRSLRVGRAHMTQRGAPPAVRAPACARDACSVSGGF